MKADSRKVALPRAALALMAAALCSVVQAHGQQEPPRLGIYWVDDALEGTFESPSWDIWSVQVTQSKTPVIFTLIASGPIDRDGGDTSTTGETRFSVSLTDPVTQASQEIVLVLTADDEQWWIDGALIDPHSGMHVYDPYIEGGRLDMGIWPGYISGFVFDFLDGRTGPVWLEAELSDTGTGVPDRVAGWVPEPGTLSLLVVGGLGLLARRPTRMPSARRTS